MKYAYLVIAHNEPTVLCRLVDLLDDVRNDIFIMLDKKADMGSFAHIKTKSSRLIWVDRIDNRWGSDSQIRTELLLFRTALQYGDYSRFVLLSGVSLPLKSQDIIHNFIDTHDGVEFVSINSNSSISKGVNDRVCYYHIGWHMSYSPNRYVAYCGALLYRWLIFLQRRFRICRNKDMTFYKGDQWCCITREFCKWLVEKEDIIWSIFKDSCCGDEVFIQTMLMYSPFSQHRYEVGGDGISASLHRYGWSRGKDGHPYVWKVSDWEELKEEPNLFARKFSSSDPFLLDLICKNQ